MAKASGTQASKLVSSGAYEYTLLYDGGISLAHGDNEVEDFAATSESLLTWVRLHYEGSLMVDAATAQGRHCTLVCWKQDGAPDLPDVTSGDIIETLRRDGKLFFLKHVFLPGYLTGRSLQWETEFRNVKLRAGERLCWGIYNHGAAVTALYNEFFVLEYRLVTV